MKCDSNTDSTSTFHLMHGQKKQNDIIRQLRWGIKPSWEYPRVHKASSQMPNLNTTDHHSSGTLAKLCIKKQGLSRVNKTNPLH